MASSRQIQVMKLRVMEKLDDIFSQQKTIIATIKSMSSEVKKKADSLLKSLNNEVTVFDFVNVLQDLERCFNNLIAIAAATDDLYTPDDPTSVGGKNPLTQDALSEYQVKWSNPETPEFHQSESINSFNMTRVDHDNTFSSTVESLSRQQITSDAQNNSPSNSWPTNQYSSRDNKAVNFSRSRTVDPPVDADFTASQAESVPQQRWSSPNSDSDHSSSQTSLLRSPGKDIASIPNIVSVAPFNPKSLSIEEPYALGPELIYQRLMSNTNIQVCETVTPYCFWVHMSSSVSVLQELASEIYFFISSSKYNTSVDYGISCPSVGMACIAPFTDGSHYRARVLSEVETPDDLDPKVNVLYVDYGNMDFISTSSLRKMPNSLAKYPTQAICCALANVKPIEINEDWSATASEAFHNMVYSKNLLCKPASGDNFIPQIVDLYLLESTSDMSLEDLQIMQESKVNSILIEQGFAQPITQSCQIQKIYQIVKNWILFKSTFSPNEADNLVTNENSPVVSTPFTGLPQASDNSELHHQSSVTSNSQVVASKSDTAAVETVITSSADDCSSMENSNSGGLSPATLPQQSIQTSSSKSSLSSVLESVDSKSNLNGSLAVMISQVESPSSFYVHHINKETSAQLEKLVQDLNVDFHCLTASQLTMLCSELVIEKGQLCCAYVADEQAYYRGLIIEHKTDISEVIVKVFYIDFGNSDWLHCDNIYPLPPQYSKISALAQHCALAYVKPQKPTWPDEAKAAFKNLIKPKETYFIMTVSGSSTLEIPSLANFEKAPVEVLMSYCDGSVENGSDHDGNEMTEICLNYELIDLNHADLDVDNLKDTGLVEWNPMLEDFDSRRNHYDVNIDDAEIAAVGFKVNDEVKICKFFRDGRRCWLGKKCPYKHIRLERDCFTADKRVAVCDVGLLGQIELPRVRSFVGVEVSAVSSPVLFYVIFPWGTESVKNLNSMPVCPSKEETLPDLQESLQKYYKKLPPRTEENLLWTIGELVVARAPADEQWYRARISEVGDSIVKVFFVDFGNAQWIPEKHIQTIEVQFVHLPHQAVECCLDGIVSSSSDGLWTEEARDYFLELIDDKVLVAHINSIISKRLYINLVDTSKEEDMNIAEELVRVGAAQEVKAKLKPCEKSPVNRTNQPESTKSVFFTPG